MSFQSLISGSECAAPANPLNQVLKHTDGDRSLQQDRLAGPSSSRLQFLPTTSVPAASEQDLALARQFFEANGAGPAFRPAFSVPGPALAGPAAPEFNEAWVTEQQARLRHFESQKAQSPWATEFGSSKFLPQGPSTPQSLAGPQDFQQNSSYAPSMGMYSPQMTGMYGMGMGMNMNMYQGPNANYVVDQGKGKARSRDADFDAAFEQAASLVPTQTTEARIVELEDVSDLNEAFEQVHLEPTQAEPRNEFRKVWDHLQNSDLPPPKEDLAKWEAEFNQLMNSQREDDLDYDFSKVIENTWQQGVDNDRQENVGPEPIKFDSEGIPILGNYIFEPNNKYLTSTSTSSPLAEAKALLERNGSLSEAALLLEAAVQKGDLGEGGYETWILLGETRNMDEREEAGMRALTEGVKRAEAVGAAGAGMLSLAISFTNESYERAAHTMLLRWITARYPSHHVPQDTFRATQHTAWDANSRITEVFLDLARTQHNQGAMEAEVQIALGVLFYSTNDYDRAKDCFQSALSLRPQDYLLWNRLGSSLSNGNKPEEALGAYREALQLRPTYTRAIYNVGVACLNIGAHKEAAEHFLSALSMQEQSAGETSDQLWFTLRRALMSMDRADLADRAKAGTSLESFRKEGFDF
ncbi:hypothetical protein IW261DRAFT_1451818 [Armillaria novae-zelandiae]|uniref:Peroxisomal targeting signal receptor n=1 Tax=Armillaria novae-zelandiae TaxID=153914 RepID=A0AA39PM85_9AGAR|nr:hypothetical protein IW261DRAFT_1451818 [Armillaria novae-zelandiae]